MAKVTVYSTPTCMYCKLAKDYFDKNNIEYEEVDVAQEQERAEEMVQKSGQMGVPVIIVAEEGKDEEVIVGFDQSKLAELLGIK